MFVCALLCSHALAQTNRPNIIVFLVDDMGVMDTSAPMVADQEGPSSPDGYAATGNPVRHPLNDWYRTPSMERLAAQGVRFSNFYAHTVCSPSRISILTGQNSARHHATDWIHPWENNGGAKKPPEWDWEGLTPGEVSLPAVLKQAGYTTIHVGKGHVTPANRDGADPLNLGFDVNVAGSDIGAPASYYGERGYGAGTTTGIARAIPGLDQYHGTSTFLTEALTLEAKAEIDRVLETDTPFFLYMSHYAVHSPFNSDPRFAANYSGSGRGGNAEAFATLIEGMDKSLGDLMDHLGTNGAAENTLIFFLGDNGSDGPLGSHDAIASSAPLRGRKGTRWEGGIRVPFIAGWAKVDTNNVWQQALPIPTNTMRQEIGACWDLFPTITELVGAPVPTNHPVDGHNLATLLTGQPDATHRNVLLSHYPHLRGWGSGNDYLTVYRSNEWKVVYHYLDAVNRYELYNLANDPSESSNLASTHPEKLVSMLKAMVTELESKDAQYPVLNGEPVGVILEPSADGNSAKTDVPPITVRNDSVLFDFGRPDNPSVGGAHTYNNISLSSSGAANDDTGLIALVDASGAATGWSTQVTGTSVGYALGGADVTAAPTAISGLAQSAWGDSLFLQAALTVSLSGLDANRTYDLVFHGSRNNNQDQIQTWHITKGTGGTDGFHHSFDNTTHVVDWPNISPDANGEIAFTITVPGAAGALNVGCIAASASTTSSGTVIYGR